MQGNDQTAKSDRPGSTVNFRPDIVSNIPIKAQAQPNAPVNEDEDLDKLMHDVSKDLKQDHKKPPKKSFFEFKKHPKVAQPVPPPKKMPAAAKSPISAQPKPAAAATPKPPRQSTAPVLTITVTIIITGVLIAAAIYAYK